jgi:hypothetical protein
MLLVGACCRRGETYFFSSLSRHFFSSSSRSGQDLQNLATFSLSPSILQLISLTRVPIEKERNDRFPLQQNHDVNNNQKELKRKQIREKQKSQKSA